MNSPEPVDWEKQNSLYQAECLRKDAVRLSISSSVCFGLAIVAFIIGSASEGVTLACYFGAGACFSLGLFLGLAAQLVYIRSALEKLSQK